MNKYKKFIKDACNGKTGLSMCSDWKKKIESTFPELFPKSELEVGKWYKWSTTNDLLFICNPDGEKVKGYGFVGSKWYDNRNREKYYGYMSEAKDWTPATDKKVEEALIKEAIKRGYKTGNYKSLAGSTFEHNDKYNYCNNRLFSGFNKNSARNVVFDNGEWAEIIETITKEEAEKQLGKTII